jgi:hypothetical protein
MDNESHIESLSQTLSRHSVPFDPPSQMHRRGKVFGFRFVAGGVGEDEVVAEINWIARPGDEVVYVCRTRHDFALAIQATCVLHFAENWKVFVQRRTFGTKEELIEVARFTEHLSSKNPEPLPVPGFLRQKEELIFRMRVNRPVS